MRLQTLFEARWILVILAVFSVVGCYFSLWFTAFSFLLICFTIFFFRDPNRSVPTDPKAVVAAADGTVTDITEVNENEILKARARRVGIFLSIFDVHTNRAPIDGRIVYRQHRQGLCLDARRSD